MPMFSSQLVLLTIESEMKINAGLNTLKGISWPCDIIVEAIVAAEDDVVVPERCFESS